MCKWIIIISTRQRRMLCHYSVQHCIQIMDSFFTLSISNSKKILYRQDFVHTLEYLQITCFSYLCFLKVQDIAAGQEWKDCHELKVTCPVNKERMLPLSECFFWFVVVHIFFYCRTLLGYNRLLVYFFLKIALWSMVKTQYTFVLISTCLRTHSLCFW